MSRADTPAEQATRRPRRTPAVVALEARIADLEADLRGHALTATAAARQHDADVGTILRAVARAEHAERLLARAVAALGQWTDDLGGLDPRAADVLLETVAEVLGIDPDQRPPRARRGGPPPATAWRLDAGDHAEHPDDDEPPTEP
jgi:hypothetical protein